VDEALNLQMRPFLSASLARHEPLLRTLGAATGVGMALGLIIGGVGGRLAMRALFLTTGPGVRGVISDDGFEIGRFSIDTINLLATGMLMGIFGAFTYLGVRPFLMGPMWLRSLGCALAAGAVVGTTLVNPEGVDFTALSPVWFAIALFVGIPAVFGAVAPATIEWILRPSGLARTAPLGWVLSPLLVFLFPPLLVLVGLPVALVLLARYALATSPRLQTYARHAAAMWAARAAWLGIALLGVAALREDLAALL
jgi:hypothetical protein